MPRDGTERGIGDGPLAALGQSTASVASTLAIGAAGGALFAWAGMPAAWLAGAMIAVAASAIGTRVPLLVPAWMREVAFVLIGMSIGAGVTPDTLWLMHTWPLSIALLAVSIAATVAASSVYLERVHRWDRATARFSAIPGALAAVLAMAARGGVDLPRVALAQSLRLFILVAVMPLILRMTTPLPAPDAPLAAADGDGILGVVALLAASGAGAYLFHRFRLPGDALLGAMLVSSVLHGADLAHGQLPSGLLVAGFLVAGAVIGARFRGVPIATLRRALGPAVGSVAIALCLSAAFAGAGAAWLGVPFGQLWIAYAPGGLEAMTIVAFALGLDAAFIGTHHVVRFLGIGVLTPVWQPRIGGLDKERAKETVTRSK
ncbi:AbrB family transcriptional regulator [Azospirillum sp.]|uniref:AbrB family transcriptional regulator n=1 Tax=Azospirillum sp. TaxID=34012 RepID=UPI003D740697